MRQWVERVRLRERKRPVPELRDERMARHSESSGPVRKLNWINCLRLHVVLVIVRKTAVFLDYIKLAPIN